MKRLLLQFSVLAFGVFILACSTSTTESTEPLNAQNCMVRIAELTIDSTRLEEYLAILKEEAAESVRKEPGVITIFPMQVQAKPTDIRLIEIYASRAAYKTHLQTPHFLHYKNATLEMVQSLELIEMKALDPDSMRDLFVKLSNK